MLTRLDDYLIHQTPEPLAHPATSDRNAYDRYFFNGYSPDGEIFFAAALGLYPNRRVTDASFSVVRGGRQYALHASRLAPFERTETRVGPISVEVIEPMRNLRLRVGPNEFGLEAELEFQARSAAIEEPRFVHRVAGHVALDYTRLTQFGHWSGSLSVDGEQLSIEPARVVGCRDRSWGIRPVGEREAGAPGPLPQFFWLWAPITFDDSYAHFAANEDAAGKPWHASGCLVPALEGKASDSYTDDSDVERMAAVEHRVKWRPGSRRAESAEIRLTPHDGSTKLIELEPILTFQMLGLGYLHPEWGHGMWKGEEAIAFESWILDELDPLDPRYLHVQQLCRARMEGRTGVGVLEQLVIGAHAPSGFKGLLDGAS